MRLPISGLKSSNRRRFQLHHSFGEALTGVAGATPARPSGGRKKTMSAAARRKIAATQRARLDYAAERLRLLYVGITRARRELIITWNMGRFAAQNDKLSNQPALPLVALWEYVGGTLKV